jgi:hypothetical protein
MKVNYYNEENKFPYILVDDMYDDHELSGIWQELDYYSYSEKLKPSDQTMPALDRFGNILKKNKGLQLDEIYKENRIVSNILSINRKIFNNNASLLRDHPNWFFKNLYVDRDFTLLSYYENGDYYKAHQDASLITGLFWFHKEDEKKFRGGNLHFPGYKIEIEVKNNRGVIFPSTVWHSVDRIEMNEEHLNKGLGRWCMTQFLSFIQGGDRPTY